MRHRTTPSSGRDLVPDAISAICVEFRNQISGPRDEIGCEPGRGCKPETKRVLVRILGVPRRNAAFRLAPRDSLSNQRVFGGGPDCRKCRGRRGKRKNAESGNSRRLPLTTGSRNSATENRAPQDERDPETRRLTDGGNLPTKKPYRRERRGRGEDDEALHGTLSFPGVLGGKTGFGETVRF